MEIRQSDKYIIDCLTYLTSLAPTLLRSSMILDTIGGGKEEEGAVSYTHLTLPTKA